MVHRGETPHTAIHTYGADTITQIRPPGPQLPHTSVPSNSVIEFVAYSAICKGRFILFISEINL